MGFANGILGGAASLVRAAIKSPNFVTGSAGWAVRKDGSAEFNNLTARGAIVVQSSGGMFIYTGTPALGNPPVIAITNQATDPYGNSVRPGDAFTNPALIALGGAPPGGTQSYAQVGPSPTNPGIDFGTGDVNESAPGIITSGISGAGGTRRLFSSIQPPVFTQVNVQVLNIYSASQDATKSGLFEFLNGPLSSLAGTAANPTLITTDSPTVVSLANTWTSAAGLIFKRLPDGNVHVWGVLQPGAAAPVTTVCNVPPAYQPKTSGGASMTVNALAADVTASPNVVHNLAIDTTMRIAGTYAAGTDNVVVNFIYPLVGP